MNRIATIVKGYPRLSETFIAQEILGLEKRGIAQLIVSLRQPTDDENTRPQPRDLGRNPLPAGISEGRRSARKAGALMVGIAAGLRARMEGVPQGPRARPVGQPPAPLRPGLRAGARIARRYRLAAHALPPHARVGRALRRAHPRHRVVFFRARQGYLDDAAMGSPRQARRCRMGRHLHASQSRLSALAQPASGKCASRLSRARFFALSSRAGRECAPGRNAQYRLGGPRRGEEGIFRSPEGAVVHSATIGDGGSSMSAAGRSAAA